MQNLERVLAGQRGLVLVDLDIRIDVAHPVGGRIELLAADVLGAVNHLPLQVGEIHHVEIHQADAADARRRQIQPERRAQAARADQQHLGLLQLQLAFHADFRHDQMAAVAQNLVFGQRYPGRRSDAGRAARDAGHDRERVVP